MKNLYLFVFWTILFSACSSTENKKKQSQADVQASDNTIEQSVYDTEDGSADLLIKYHDKIKEALFFQTREAIDGLGEYRFLKSEKIKLEGNKLEYTLVTLPVEYVKEYQEKLKVLEAGMYRGDVEVSSDDSVMISATITVDSLVYNTNESIDQITLSIEGRMKHTYLYSSPYGGPERGLDYDDYLEKLIVNVTNSRIYSKEQYYLKARIQKLTEVDLKTLSNEELAYLRNEIFARHGHTFKTDKMKNYFSKQEWYQAYANNATDWLNEVEKWNAQYIKTFEN